MLTFHHFLISFLATHEDYFEPSPKTLEQQDDELGQR